MNENNEAFNQKITIKQSWFFQKKCTTKKL